MRPASRRRTKNAEFDVRMTTRGRTAGTPKDARTRPAAARSDAPSIPESAKLGWVPHDAYVTSTGARVVHLQQYHQGLRVYRSARVVKFEGRGAAPTTAGTKATIPPSLSLVPRLTAAAALGPAIAHLRRRGAFSPSFEPRVVQAHCFNLPGRPTMLTCRRGLREPVRAHLEIFPAGRAQARLAWVLELAPATAPRYEVAVSADTRRPTVLFSTKTTSCLDFDASWIPFPQAAATPRRFPIPSLASPIGKGRPPASLWLEAAGTAKGPNASCHSGDTREAHRLTGLQFENTFVWCNLLRDFFAAFGFDRSMGAFDSGEDPLEVRLFSSKSSIGGHFENQVDGHSPTMELFAPVIAAGFHAALDPSILIHEYTHGVSNRILGGAALASPFVGREGKGLNEGYSDYFALTLLTFMDRPGAGRDLRRIGSAFKPPGVRDYSSFKGSFSANINDEHALGMVWCGALLDARIAVAAIPGTVLDDVDSFLWQALLDSLRRMVPVCSGSTSLTFKHAKDALLTASRALEAAQPAFARASAVIDAALTARKIV